jgi:Zn-dependent proteases
VKGNLRLGRLFGISVAVHWSTLLIFAVVGTILAGSVLPQAAPGRPIPLYWGVSTAAATVFLGCLLAHELAHGVVARRRGVAVRSITLWMLGGVSQLEGEPPDPKADLAIAAAGPLTSLAAGVVLGAGYVLARLAEASALVVQLLLWLAMMNVVLAVFNLLPGAPLDGGRILRALLWRRYQDLSRADLAAARAGRTLGLTILWLGVAQVLFVDLVGGIWTMLIGWFLMNAARMETDARLVRQALAELSAAQVMRPVPDRVAAWHTVQACIEQTIAHSWQSLFPVVDEDGGAVGLITTDQLIAIPAQRRGQVSVRDVMTALPAQNVRRPEARAIDLIEIRPIGRLVAVIVDDHHIVGIITVDDFNRMVRRGLLLKTSADPGKR